MPARPEFGIFLQIIKPSQTSSRIQLSEALCLMASLLLTDKELRFAQCCHYPPGSRKADSFPWLQLTASAALTAPSSFSVRDEGTFCKACILEDAAVQEPLSTELVLSQLLL